MAPNTPILHPHKSKQPEKNNARYNSKMKKTSHAYTRQQRNQTIQVKAIVIPISTYKNKHMQNTNSRSKENRGCLVQLYEAIITI
jgi:hypothetical protein